MLEKLIQRGKSKLDARRKAEQAEQSERQIACRKLFNRLIPKAVRKYATIKDYDRVSANFSVSLPEALYRVERYVTYDGKKWSAMDDGAPTSWAVMDDKVPDDPVVEMFDSLDMALARSLEK